MNLKHNKLKALVTGLLAASMCIPTAVSAEEGAGTYVTTDSIIDYDQKGSITLYKYMDNNGNSVDASGVQLTDDKSNMLAAVKEKVGDDDIFPEKGVQFKALKIADIEQITENSNYTADAESKTADSVSVTGTYYTNIDSEFFSLAETYLGRTITAADSTRRTDGRTAADAASEVDDHYTSDELNADIMAINRAAAASGSERYATMTGETALNKYIRTNTKALSFDPTDEDGYTKLDNLDVGLYLICEVDYEHSALSKHESYWEIIGKGDTTDPMTGDKGDTEDAGTENSGLQSAGVDAGGSQYADVASPSSPFLLSIPMTNIADIKDADGNLHEAGTVWQYDITAYPKNASINIHKDIVTNDYAGQTNGGTTYGGLTGNDGNDVAADKTLCNLHQTNYLPEDGTADAIDGDQKTGLTHQIDANIGDIVTHLISSDVPALVDDLDNEDTASTSANRKHNSKYIISDRMTKGLKLIDSSSFKVMLSSGAWNDYDNEAAVQFIMGDDFTVEIADDKQSFVLTLTSAGLAKLDAFGVAPGAGYLYVLYDTEVTKDALIGTDTYGNQRIVTKDGEATETSVQSTGTGDSLDIDASKTDTTYTNENGVSHPEATNQNTAKLTYATDRTMDHDYYSNTVKVFTYELDLTKIFTDGTQGNVSKNADGKPSFDYKQVKFTVRGSVTDGSEHSDGSGWEDLIFIRTGDGTYRVWDKATDGGEWDEASDTLEQAASEKTITKYVTPNSENGLLTIAGVDARTYEFTERSTAKGRNLMADEFYVELVAPVVDSKTLENGKVEHAYIWTGDKPADDKIGDYDLAAYQANLTRMNEGRVPFVLQNNEIIKVLKTGGAGTYIWIGVGAAVLILGGIWFIIRKKKNDDADQAGA